MTTKHEVVHAHYDTQYEFAEDFPKMLDKGYLLSNINFKKDTKDNFTAMYISRPMNTEELPDNSKEQ